MSGAQLQGTPILCRIISVIDSNIIYDTNMYSVSYVCGINQHHMSRDPCYQAVVEDENKNMGIRMRGLQPVQCMKQPIWTLQFCLYDSLKAYILVEFGSHFLGPAFFWVIKAISASRWRAVCLWECFKLTVHLTAKLACWIGTRRETFQVQDHALTGHWK